MEQKLSIIIPLYNSENYFGQCIDSLLALQLNKEIIVIDDGSTDKSYSMALEYANKGKIRLLHQENKGVSEARNLGLENITGDIVAFVDSDDYILIDNFCELYKKFIASNADMGMGGVCFRFESGDFENHRAAEYMWGRLYDGQQCFSELMKTNTFTPLVFSYLFRRSFIEEHKFRFAHRMSEDDLWTTVAMCEAKKVMINTESHYCYCKHEESITGLNSATLFRAENHLAVANDLYTYMSQRKLREDAEIWLCCKILYIVSIAVNIFAEKRNWDCQLDVNMYQDIFKRLLSTSDMHAKKVGLMFGGRIIKTIKECIGNS